MDASADLSAGAPRGPLPLVRRLSEFSLLMRLDRPIGSWLLLWPTLWALWIAANGHPRRRLFAIFVAGTILMRSAGCIVNDLADRNIDPHVKRTRMRPLAARLVSPYEALVLFGVLLALALALALQLNLLSIKFAFVGAVLTVSYPWLKRFFPLPQLYLGLSFGWAVPMAFAATLGAVPRVGWLIFVIAVLWAGVYDTMYAMVDRDDDVRVGVRSSAILFGDLDRVMVGAMQLMVLWALLLVGRSEHFGDGYRWGLVGGAVCFAWQ
jgi:4-hydroxybenzoate polyprenyltransferase